MNVMIVEFRTVVVFSFPFAQVELKPVELLSAEDHLEHTLAIERRRIRLGYVQVFQKLMQESNKEGDFCTQHRRWNKHLWAAGRKKKTRQNISLGLWCQVENLCQVCGQRCQRCVRQLF